MILEVFAVISRWAIPLFILAILVAGLIRRVPVYESFVAGAKEGFDTALRILPYLLAMFFGIAILRDSGTLDAVLSLFAPLVEPLGIPREVLPLAILRPLSGSGALGVVSELMRTHGADSFIGLLASTIQGSTETTFYVLTVYFGSVGIRNVRHAVSVGLMSDLAGFLASVFIVHLVFGAALS